MSISLKARFDTTYSLKAQIDEFVEYFWSLDFSDEDNSFYLALF